MKTKHHLNEQDKKTKKTKNKKQKTKTKQKKGRQRNKIFFFLKSIIEEKKQLDARGLFLAKPVKNEKRIRKKERERKQNQKKKKSKNNNNIFLFSEFSCIQDLRILLQGASLKQII